MDKHEKVLASIETIASGLAGARGERQMRRSLEKEDFDALRDAGFLLAGVSEKQGGLWQDARRSTRPIAGILRVLGAADPSVALVSSMHPAVLAFWLSRPDAPPEHAAAWREQTEWTGTTALEGHWWGTITSEPGSGGDVANSRAVASRDGGGYRISGQKHFGSGSGITSFMLTSAVPEGEGEADWFFFDVRGAAWDGSTGMQLIAPWDGHGMAATQSHAFEFDHYPATRFAWPRELRNATVRGAGAPVSCYFTAVIAGVVDSAMAAARPQIERKRSSLRPYELVEWARAENEAWLIEQALEGMLRAVEARGSDALLETLRGKTAIAELAESVMARICKVIGGATFGRSSPFGFWYEDVRALGFLRPPWGLAFDNLAQMGAAAASG